MSIKIPLSKFYTQLLRKLSVLLEIYRLTLKRSVANNIVFLAIYLITNTVS